MVEGKVFKVIFVCDIGGKMEVILDMCDEYILYLMDEVGCFVFFFFYEVNIL